VQFEVANLVLVRGSRAAVLSCAAPRQVFRFQRRNAFRVRPLMRSAPMARLLLGDPPVDLDLRVIDVSIGGCAVFLPDDLAAPPAGTRLERAEIDLDADTRFKVDMRLQ